MRLVKLGTSKKVGLIIQKKQPVQKNKKIDFTLI